MATLAELLADQKLFRLDPVLPAGEQEFRLIYTSDRLKTWLEQNLPSLASSWKIEESPAEQLDALIAIFAAGDQLTFEWQFKPITPIGDGVWELKTADVRVFGWFPLKDHFIGYVADTAERVKQYNLYYGYRGEVVRFRDQLPLDEPKFVPGDNPDDVVSNYTQAN